MLACIPTASLFGVDADPVTIEVQVHPGLPCTTVVGGPDATCREAKERVRAAFASCGFQWPNKRVTINLSPAWQKKRGSAIDLAMAVGILLASDQLPVGSIEGYAFLGELGLDGAIRPVVGVVPLAEAAGGDPLVVPLAQVVDARLATARVVGVGHLADLVKALKAEAPWPLPRSHAPACRAAPRPDLADVRGQAVARAALEVAAAGGHHLLLTGPPGGGKTMLAERLPGLLPPLTAAEALEVTKIHSAAGVLPAGGGLLDEPPYEAPHTTASAVALIGGGSSQLRPGAISLAHGSASVGTLIVGGGPAASRDYQASSRSSAPLNRAWAASTLCTARKASSFSPRTTSGTWSGIPRSARSLPTSFRAAVSSCSAAVQPAWAWA